LTLIFQKIKCYAGFPRPRRGITETRLGEGCDSGKVNFTSYIMAVPRLCLCLPNYRKMFDENYQMLCVGIRKWILKSRKIILLEFDRSQTFSEGSLDPSKTFPVTLIRKNNDQLTNQYKVDEILNSRISIL